MALRASICLCLALSLSVFFVNCGNPPPSEKATENGGTKDAAGETPAPDTAKPTDNAPTDNATPKDTAPTDTGGGCTGGKTDCDGTCVDTQTDKNNCGACGSACSGGEICDIGVCQEPSTPQCDPDPGYAKVQAIFTGSCSCHIGGTSGGLSLKDPDSKANLVDKPSSGGKVYVKPGDVAGSYLVDKVEGASGISGSKMPLGGGDLTAEQLKDLKAWICNGAK